MATKKTTAKVKSRTESTERVDSKTNLFDYLRFGESYTSLILGIVVVIITTVLLLSFVRTRNTTQTNNPSQQLSSQQNAQKMAQAASSPTLTATPTVEQKKATPTVAKKPTATVTPAKPTVTAKPTSTPKSEDKKVLAGGASYTVVKGDTLWKIAEKTYKSGYNWVDIARANNLSNPGLINAGNKLVLPKVQPKIATVVTPAPSKTDKNKTVAQKSVLGNSAKITGNTYKITRGDTLWNIAVRAYGDGYQWVKIAQANNLSNPNLIHSDNQLKIPRG